METSSKHIENKGCNFLKKRKIFGTIKIFTYNGENIEIVDQFTYLGNVFTYNGNFLKARKHLTDQASKATFGLFRKINSSTLPVDCQLKLFDQCIMPILCYSSEIWGFENTSILENIHLKFCKTVLGVKKSTPNFMVYGELGKFPLSITIKCRIISFWAKLVSGKASKISYLMYKLLYSQHEANVIHSRWMQNVKSILTEVGVPGLWYNQVDINASWLNQHTRTQLQNQFLQSWLASIDISSLGINYKIFKSEFIIEPYLINVPERLRKSLTRFRTSNHRLAVETGRWTGTPRELRVCGKCNSGALGDEFHFLFECRHYDEARNRYMKPYYFRRPNVFKYKQLFEKNSGKHLRNLAIFIKISLLL